MLDKFKRIKILITILATVLFLNNLISVSYANEINGKNETSDIEFWSGIAQKWDQLSLNSKPEEEAKKEIMSAIMAYQVEQIVKGATTDQDKCLRIARWISSNISNREPMGSDEYGWYAYRSGLCGSRARIFVEMLKYQHIPARVFNMYNFGRVGGGHSCAQAYYDGNWHFFDVTYAGVFMKDGNVLSWEEIKLNPEQAMKNLYVFEQTIDRWGSTSDDPVLRRKVDNNERMHIAYSADILMNANSYGFYRYEDVKILYPVINWESTTERKISVGKLDKNLTDVTMEGYIKGISEQLGVSLGTGTDTFHTEWQFKNCKLGKSYLLKYYVYKANATELKYWAKGTDAKIMSGASFSSSQSLVNEMPEVWEIKFIPTKQECTISVGYDFREQQKLVFVDMIEIIEQ